MGRVFQFPPVSKRKNGITLLEPSIMTKYLEEFHKELNAKELIDADQILTDSRNIGLAQYVRDNCFGKTNK